MLINREDFFEILRKEAPLAVKLLWAFIQELTSRLRATNEELSVARTGAVDSEPSDEIVDLSEEIIITESSAAMSRTELDTALREDVPIPVSPTPPSPSAAAIVREPSDTLTLDPADLEVLDAGTTATSMTRDALGPEPDAPRDPLRTTMPVLGNQAAGRFGKAARDSMFDVRDDDDDIHTRATRPIDVIKDDPT